MMKTLKWSLVLLLSALSTTHAAIPVNQTQVVSANKNLASMVPAATTVTITAAGTYTLTLSDVQKSGPGNPFSSLSVVLSQGAQLIKHLVLPPTTSVPASDVVTLAAGQYQVQVLGVTTGVSQYSVKLTTANNVEVMNDSAVVTAPATNDFSTLQQVLPVVAAQTYTVTLTDQAFPVALGSLSLIVTQGSNQAGNCNLLAAGSCSFVATGTSAVLTVLAPSSSAGLYSVKVTNNTSSTVTFAKTFPVGDMPEPISLALPTAGAYSLTSFDLLTPDPLRTFKLALVQAAEVPVKQLAGGGAVPSFTGSAGDALLYVIALPKVNSAGLYSVQIKQGTTSVYSKVSSVEDAANTGLEGYVFKATLPAAGNYSLRLTDFAFPQLLSTLSANVSQDGVVLGTLSAQGTLAITGAAAGEISIAVLGKPATNAAGGLFGFSLSASGSNNTPLLEKTQGVGGSFASVDATVDTAAEFVIGFNDFAAPLSLSSLNVAITRGSSLLGTIIGGNAVADTTPRTYTLPVDATPGTYTLSYLATASGSGFGMYGVTLATAPTLTLAPGSGSVGSGGSTTLTWDASDANTCTASGGWSGSKALSGTAPVGPISGDTTYTLTCTGPGGTTAKSATVTIQIAASSSGGGGGAMSLLLLLGLGLLACTREYARPR